GHEHALVPRPPRGLHLPERLQGPRRLLPALQRVRHKTTGFRLPTFPTYDIPMMFADKCFDPTSKLLAFDLFNLDGILGDKFPVNGVIQPVLHVSPRRYRFRWLNTGPSRFVQMYLTDLGNPSI